MTPRRRCEGLESFCSATWATALAITSTSGVDSTCAVVAAVRPQPVRVRAWVWRAGCGVSSAVVDIKVEVTWE